MYGKTGQNIYCNSIVQKYQINAVEQVYEFIDLIKFSQPHICVGIPKPKSTCNLFHFQIHYYNSEMKVKGEGF